MKYQHNTNNLVTRVSFAENYGVGSSSSSYGGGTRFLGLINKGSGTTYHHQEGNWYINFDIATNLATINRLQLTDISYGTFMMVKLNGSSVFVGPNGGNNLLVSGYREVKTKGDRKYVGVVGRRVTITTYYPEVDTGAGRYALGLDNIANQSQLSSINLLPYVRQGQNNLEIKVITLGRNKVSFNLDASERLCLHWQENWQEKCTINITEP